MNYSQQHLSLSRIKAYLDESLSHEEIANIKQHLDDCQACSDMLAISSQLRAIVDDADVPNPPDTLLEKAVKAAVKRVSRGADVLKRFLPKIADSKLSASAVGMRGIVQNRHVLYADDESTVFLEIESASESDELFTLRGQVSMTEPQDADLIGTQVQLVNEQGLVRSSITDQLGQFRISGLANDIYSLQIEQPTHDIIIDDLEF